MSCRLPRTIASLDARRLARVCAAGLLLVGLTACGGGGSGSSAACVPATEAPAVTEAETSSEEPTAETAAPLIQRADDSEPVDSTPLDPDLDPVPCEPTDTTVAEGETAAAEGETPTEDTTAGESASGCAEAGAEAAATETTDTTVAEESASEDTSDEEPSAETAAPLIRRSEEATTDTAAAEGETADTEAAAAEGETAAAAQPCGTTSTAAKASDFLPTDHVACVEPSSAEATAGTEESSAEDASTDTTMAEGETTDTTAEGETADTSEEPTAETAAPLIRRSEEASTDTAAAEGEGETTDTTAEGEATGGGEATAEATAAPCVAVVWYNDADLTFIGDLLARLDTATVIADTVDRPDTGARAEVLDFAEKLRSGPPVDTAALEELLATWGAESLTTEGASATTDESALTLLSIVTGPDFDELWLRVAAGHELKLAAIGKTAMRRASNETVKTLADELMTSSMSDARAMVDVLRS